MTQVFPVNPDSDVHRKEPSRWQQNHGNLILCFVTVILMVGAGMLFYEQNLSLKKPRFPDSGSIAPVNIPFGNGGTGIVTIRITGAANDLGTMKMFVYGSEATFSSQPDAVFTSVERISGGVRCL